MLNLLTKPLLSIDIADAAQPPTPTSTMHIYNNGQLQSAYHNLLPMNLDILKVDTQRVHRSSILLLVLVFGIMRARSRLG
jgi:hypothetical protein